MVNNNKRIKITELTIKRLYSISGNRCALSDCDQQFFDSEGEINISNICHIEAAKKNGQRYNPNTSDKDRASFYNLILLCPNHHKVTDNTEIYTVECLKKMKANHEGKTILIGDKKNIISKYPSALNTVIKSLGSVNFDRQNSNEPMSAPDPEYKIKYNNVIKFKPIIENYKIYQGRLNKIYQEIETQGSTRKEFILQTINSVYLLEKSKYDGIEKIRANADGIIDSVESSLWEMIENSNNINVDLPIEVIKISLYIILVDAFMRCSILEEPLKNDN